MMWEIERILVILIVIIAHWWWCCWVWCFWQCLEIITYQTSHNHGVLCWLWVMIIFLEKVNLLFDTWVRDGTSHPNLAGSSHDYDDLLWWFLFQVSEMSLANRYKLKDLITENSDVTAVPLKFDTSIRCGGRSQVWTVQVVRCVGVRPSQWYAEDRGYLVVA